ncbi:protein mono-ADP-ribosyltransferase PARP12-like [Eucyclogobius newberryi]|uniref:protein mono-ADP-ribosyltransferase PARP12-like n=1 Tax=Eucyclogobius newberryi TaxID=166745 RepID=UPI003B5B6868
METDILTYILDNQGAVVTADLLFNLCNDTTLSDLICNNDKFVPCLINGTPHVVVRTKVRLCWRKDCPGCGGLHLCKGFFLTGSCHFSHTRRGCIFSHDLHSHYNGKILTEFGLETLSRAQLCLLLLQSNSNILPSICHNYNNRNGCEDSCLRLHVCQRFLSQDCSCFRTHDFLAPQPLKVLQDKRIPDCLITSLKSIYANKEALWIADKSDNGKNRGNPSNYSETRTASSSDLTSDYDRRQDSLNSGYNQNEHRGRGGRGRGGHFRGGRGKSGSRQDISSNNDFTAASISFMNSNVLLNSQDKCDSLDSGSSDSDLSSTGVLGGFGKGENTGARGGRRGRGRRGNSQQSDASHSHLIATNKVDFRSYNPTHNNDKRQSQGQRDKTEICMFFIKGHCKYEDRCFKAHVKMPYVWEMNLNGQWTAMADNEKIEQAYCYPENTYSSTCPLVYFDTMKCGENAVRRLSTINSVLEPDFLHTTDWLWYWEDDHGKWLQYGADTNVHQLASVTSKHLEEMYLNNDKAVVQFKAGSQSYEISFQDMIQTNIKYSTKRIVRRRPQFVSAAEVPTKRKRVTNPTAVPDYWDKTQISPTEHKRISLQPSLAEYKEIHNLFCQTMNGFDILKIERNQNKAVWEAFQLHKTHMKNKNSGKPVAERKLFHGTDPLHVETICATNFDWRLCGVNGTAYGQGSYFARDAKYSHSYTGTSQLRFMFVSRVLVGDYARGSSEYRRPPSKDGSNMNLYDSCVDNIVNPSIFVVFEKQQIYPEYVLQYKERSQTTYHQPAALTTPAPTPAVTPSVAPAASTVSSNALVTNLTTTSPLRPANTLASNLTTTSSTRPSYAPVTNLTTTSSTRPANTLASNLTTTSPTRPSYAPVTNLTTTSPTRPSNAPGTRPVSLFSSTSSHPLQTSPSSASVRSSDFFVSDPSFRFSPTTSQASSTPTRSSTAFPRSSSKQQKTCVVS